MKKLISFVLLLVIAFSIMGAIPTKMVKLTIINKSGYDVYMRLEGSPLTDTFHYLTIEAGDRDAPVTKLFTIMSDVYTRTTWQCNGLESTGNLVVDGNIRLTFYHVMKCNVHGVNMIQMQDGSLVVIMINLLFLRLLIILKVNHVWKK